MYPANEGLFLLQSIVEYLPKLTPADALVVTEKCLLETCRNKQLNFFGSYKVSKTMFSPCFNTVGKLMTVIYITVIKTCWPS